MPTYDSKELPLNCPNPKCKRQMKVRYSEIYNSRRTKCNYCGAEINFEYNAVNNFKYACDDIIKADEKFNKAVNEILTKAEIKMKL